MRFVDAKYQNLAEGYLCAQSLDAKFLAHPVHALLQKQEAARRKKRLQRMTLITGACWVTVPWLVVIGLLGPDHQIGTLALVGSLIAVIVTVVSVGLALNKGGIKKDQSPVYRRWVDTVSTAYPPTKSALVAQFTENGNEDIEEYTEYGAVGVFETLYGLSRGLDDGWFALTNVMISKLEDADIVIAGPSGIWILESKYWAGYINIEEGRWSRVRVHYEPGRGRKSEYTRIHKRWDDQWLRQRDAIIGILKGSRLSLDGHAASDLVSGGIVLSHDEARLNADGSQKAVVNYVAYWRGTMRMSERNMCLTPEERLRVVDALLSVSQQNQKVSSEHQQAVPLAESIYADLVTKAREATQMKSGHLSG